MGTEGEGVGTGLGGATEGQRGIGHAGRILRRKGLEQLHHVHLIGLRQGCCHACKRLLLQPLPCLIFVGSSCPLRRGENENASSTDAKEDGGLNV